MSTPCSSAKANATYAIAHCTSLRCFRRATNSAMLAPAHLGVIRVRGLHPLDHRDEARLAADRIHRRQHDRPVGIAADTPASLTLQKSKRQLGLTQLRDHRDKVVILQRI